MEKASDVYIYWFNLIELPTYFSQLPSSNIFSDQLTITASFAMYFSRQGKNHRTREKHVITVLLCVRQGK